MDIASLADTFLDTYGLIAIFLIMLLKEIGVPVPIPSDLIMLGAAARAAQGRFNFVAVFLAILIPMILGGLVQFSIAKGPGRRVVYKLGAIIGLTKERLDRAMETVRKGGSVAVAVGLTTPGVRIAIIPASGLAELPLGGFIAGLVVGSTVFLALHFAIGYIGGFLLALLNLPLPILVGIIVAVLVLGIAGWALVRRISRGTGHAAEPLTLPERYAAWADASCPACIAITLVRQREMTTVQPSTAH
jgi:membrane protein DedA with SNARE-associated domain